MHCGFSSGSELSELWRGVWEFSLIFSWKPQRNVTPSFSLHQPKASLKWRIPPEARKTLENRKNSSSISWGLVLFYCGVFFKSSPSSAQQLPPFPDVLLEMSLFWVGIPTCSKPATRSLFREELPEPFRGLRSSSAHKKWIIYPVLSFSSGWSWHTKVGAAAIPFCQPLELSRAAAHSPFGDQCASTTSSSQLTDGIFKDH